MSNTHNDDEHTHHHHDDHTHWDHHDSANTHWHHTQSDTTFETKSKWVVLLTAWTMILEIWAWYITNSMALLSDGYHMGTHVLAIGLTWAVYVFTRKQSKSFESLYDKKRLFSLTGFTSGIILMFIAIVILFQALSRFIHPVNINFKEALIITFFWLLVNGVSVLILHDSDHHQHDKNIHSAYLHVLSDALTSVTAIIALLGGMFYWWYSLDSLCAILSSIIIMRWSYTLIQKSIKDIVAQ